MKLSQQIFGVKIEIEIGAQYSRLDKMNPDRWVVASLLTIALRVLKVSS